MSTARIRLEQVFFNLQNVRDIRERLLVSLRMPESPEPVIYMGGGLDRHSGLDGWYFDVVLPESFDPDNLDNMLAGEEYTMGLTLELDQVAF